MNIPLRRYWDLLAEYIRPQKRRFVFLTVLLLGSIGLQIVNPEIMKYFIDTATSGGSASNLALAALAFIMLAIVQQGVGVTATYLGETVAWNATNALRADLAQHCLNLDMSFHNDRSPGELIERIDGDVVELSNFFSQLVIRVIGNIVLLCGVLIALALQDWVVGLAFALFAVIALFVLNRVRGIAIPHSKALRAAIADLTGFLEERLAGTEDIRSSGAVDFVMNGLYQLQQRILGHQRKAWTLNMFVGFTGSTLLVVGNIIAIISGYLLFTSGAITIGAVYLFIYYINLLSRPIRELTQQTENLQNIGAVTERLADLRKITTRTQDGQGIEIGRGPHALAFDGVTFGYHADEPVLRQISFELPPGSIMGLLGRTGSGKTSLARLVFRLYDPTEGTIKLAGADIRQARLRQLRQSVALVTQDVQLFQASVRDNLTFFDDSISDERILEVIEELELSDWYRALPNGLDTRLETGGRSLSAGEGQLLAMARVFLRAPGLVILDEASSRLDPATEQRIERAIDRLLRGRTALIIAHRLSTVERADSIMILEEGRVIETGARLRLAADPDSRFARLLSTGLEGVLA
ncbi:MAG: ABC transporter ATP-binding protein/permease [Chloroflexi bacterium]|nr:ABC transporter ATP-binding protein/permease [Chloroflexota bacterium]MCL5275733.1 ABC transporter ATP-binding protein/permease [Chloroflexota bacterium]